MDTNALIVFLVTGLIAGYLASFVVGGGGLIQYLASGVIGSFVGGYLMKVTGTRFKLVNSFITQVVISTVGAIIVVFVAHLII